MSQCCYVLIRVLCKHIPCLFSYLTNKNNLPFCYCSLTVCSTIVKCMITVTVAEMQCDKTDGLTVNNESAIFLYFV